MLDSPVVAQQLTFDNFKVAKRSKDFGMKLVLPVLLHLLLNRYKIKFSKDAKLI
jgi:predicted ATPase